MGVCRTYAFRVPIQECSYKLLRIKKVLIGITCYFDLG